MEERLFQAGNLLRRLGVTANYKGFPYTAYAVALCAEHPELLLMVTKDLYPRVARQYRTTWQAVERDIRTVVGVAWRRNPALLGAHGGRRAGGKAPLRGVYLHCHRGPAVRRDRIGQKRT